MQQGGQKVRIARRRPSLTAFRWTVRHKPYPITGSPFTPSLPCAPHLCRKTKIPDPTNPGKYVYAFSPCQFIDCSTTGANAADSHVSVEDEIHVYESEIEHSESILNINFVYHLADDKFHKRAILHFHILLS